jgi:hypothetical protein
MSVRDDQRESDHLRLSPNAPQWVQQWSGPFWVEVETAIAAYWEEVAGDA